MKRLGLSQSQLRSSSFPLTNLFPPKESMKESVENRGRQDGPGPPDKHCGHFLTVGNQPHLSNIDIVVAIPRTLQTLVLEPAPACCGSVPGPKMMGRSPISANLFRVLFFKTPTKSSS
jgi:hypothetical protein